MSQAHALSGTGFQVIPFVRSNDDYDSAVTSEKKKTKGKIESNLDGKEVKSFYEDLVGLSAAGPRGETRKPGETEETSVWTQATDTATDTRGSSHRKRKRGSSLDTVKSSSSSKTYPSSRQINKFLQHAQDGELKYVQTAFEEGMDIDICDKYGWTALMCAGKAGHYNVVKYLIEKGADIHKKEYKGRTVLRITKHRKIRDYLQKIVEGINPSDDEDSEKAKYFEPFYCEVCKERFQNTTKETHETSTLHLFNKQHQPKPAQYYIPPANKGFQMLLKHGWDEEKGLGAEEQGNKFPIKTVLKRDRKGLGKDKSKAKVTHFDPKDAKAVERPPSVDERKMRITTLNKRKQKKKLAKEQKKEIAFRREFYLN